MKRQLEVHHDRCVVGGHLEAGQRGEQRLAAFVRKRLEDVPYEFEVRLLHLLRCRIVDVVDDTEHRLANLLGLVRERAAHLVRRGHLVRRVVFRIASIGKVGIPNALRLPRVVRVLLVHSGPHLVGLMPSRLRVSIEAEECRHLLRALFEPIEQARPTLVAHAIDRVPADLNQAALLLLRLCTAREMRADDEELARVALAPQPHAQDAMVLARLIEPEKVHARRLEARVRLLGDLPEDRHTVVVHVFLRWLPDLLVTCRGELVRIRWRLGGKGDAGLVQMLEVCGRAAGSAQHA